MTTSTMKTFIIYCSPAGTTRHVAQVIEKKLGSPSKNVVSFDLGKNTDLSAIISPMRDEQENICLYIGSPVYARHAVPPVMKLIAQLPNTSNGYAVPFVTWGGVSSGIALYEMAKGLTEKGYVILGAAKILAVHSGMWRSKDPLGRGHPDTEDDTMVENLVLRTTEKLQAQQVKPLPLPALAYQPPKLHKEMEKITLETASKNFPPRKVNQDACTQCGICEEECPTGALSCIPYPEFGSECIFCFNCMRLCPEGAIESDPPRSENEVKKLAQEIAEQPPSEIFV